MANIKVRTTYDANSPLIRTRPEASAELKAFRSKDDSFSAYIHADVLDFIRRQAVLGGDKEAIGLIAGRICQDPRTGPYTLVMAAAEARAGEFESSHSSVRLLPEGHKRVRRRLADAYPDREIVGWYHTHPNHTPHFSNVDLEEQGNWDDENQIGIVYGSVHNGEPFGVYQGPRAVPLQPASVGDLRRYEPQIESATRVEIKPSQRAVLPQVEARPEASPLLAPRRSWYRRLEIMLPVIVFLIFLGQGLTYFSTNRRVSNLENRLQELLASRPAAERIAEKEPAHSSSAPEPTPIPVAPESTQKPNRVDDAELSTPAKPLSPDDKSRQPSPAQRAAAAKEEVKRKRSVNKGTGKEERKSGSQAQTPSKPGEKILPDSPPSSSPKPTVRPD